MPSLYVPELEALSAGAEFRLEGEEFHHLAHVAKRRLQAPILLNSGRGTLAWAKVESLNPKFALLSIPSLHKTPFPVRPFAIGFALLKNRHDELLVEKCSELGVSDLFPLITERSVRRSADSNRFERISLAAIKQCDNPWLPKIHGTLELTQALGAMRNAGYQPILCSERKDGRPLRHFEPDLKPCFLIGPEGGWSDDEFSLMEPLPRLKLAELITRAETAAITAAAQWQGLCQA